MKSVQEKAKGGEEEEGKDDGPEKPPETVPMPPSFYSDAVEKQLCDEILVDFVYYLERCLYLWTVFNFLEIMLLLMVLVLYKIFF